MDEESKSRTPIVLAVGGVAVIALVAVVYIVSRLTPAPVQPVEQPLPMGSAEQAYAQMIHFSEPKMGRAENFLNQEETFIFGVVSNDGSRAVKQIEITVEFRDPFNEVVLRDKQRLFADNAVPLAPNDRRDFQLSYETLPATWAQTYPTIHITGLLLQ